MGLVRPLGVVTPREGVRDAGCQMHPQPRAQKGVARPHTSIHSGGTGNPAIPHAMCYNLYRALLGEVLIAPVVLQKMVCRARLGRRTSAGLDPSIRGGTTRLRCPFRYRSSCAIFHQLTGSTEWPPALPTEITPDTATSIASHPAFVTIAKRPSCGMRRMNIYSVSNKKGTEIDMRIENCHA